MFPFFNQASVVMYDQYHYEFVQILFRWFGRCKELNEYKYIHILLKFVPHMWPWLIP